MLTGMTDEDWRLVLKVFRACQSHRGDKGPTTVCSSGPCTSSPSTMSLGGDCPSGSASGTAYVNALLD